tara:strand:+ start:779 stop:1351 length:573 start_codon:yes stop_codon:yes gene_type:complete
MSKNPSYYWQYIDSKLDSLTDPRLPITKHIQWTLPVGPSTYSGAEPDNYNLAIYDHKPHDFKFIEHQCFYLVDKTVNRKKFFGWMSLYVAEERLQTILFNREILKIQPQAIWRFDRAKLIRNKRTELQREKLHHKYLINNLTTEERLYQMGYYEKFKNKYFDDERFLRVVGQPRGCVQTPEPEVLDCDGL